ncbi:hypothetical protein NQ176_g4170 [Zarea fungicola]|uniref:Uncharacterized protein n=1 Tax=Zarea fungicola TaxID=93591 RepID=A0ACC1NG60_9HYPO|nr:hypothetical protein NQ176_g4170 [Lecanicillium fungicola]
MSPVHLFRHGRPENKPLEAPSFLVPAVIEALSRSKTYQSLVQIVPGEADGYCANMVAEGGDIVITSDSDLLVHDLGDGGVALLRDIYQDDDAVVRAAVYNPRQIFKKLGLSGNSDICRFAYERWCSVHATTAMLIRACSEPIADETRFKIFCAQYKEEERADIPVLASGTAVSLTGFDPRWSELVLQMSQPAEGHGSDRVFKMFLPVLLDSPEKGTAWENSRYIRQLAYSLARCVIPGAGGSIREYRRVQSQDQSGREIAILQPSSIHSEAEELADVLQRLKVVLTSKHEAIYWIIACIILDIRGSTSDGRGLFALDILQWTKWPGETAQLIPWTFIHFIAHLKAAYYSLRMLQQLVRASAVDTRTAAGHHFAKLAQVLKDLPSLEESPNSRNIGIVLNSVPRTELAEILAHFVEMPRPQIESKTSNNRSRKLKAQNTIAKKSTKATTSSNMFGLLPVE